MNLWKVCIAKQALQWMPHGRRGKGRPKNTWKRDLEEMWIAGWGSATEQSWMETSGL